MTELLSDLLPRAAASRPDGLAVVGGSAALTYRELDDAASAIASSLRDAGARPGERVGVYLDKSPTAVAAVHGILRTGAAYVPLDPKAPPSRLGTIAEDCDLRVLVSSEDKTTKWPALIEAGAPLERIVVAEGSASASSPPGGVIVSGADVDARDTGVALTDDDLAYILYTSGSTGRPKGVMLTHRNGGSFVDWAVRALEVRTDDRISSHAPLHFDLSIFDLFASAAAMAPVFLVPKKATVLPAEAVRFMRDQALTIWYSVPSALSMIVSKGGLAPGDVPSLRAFVFAGEVFPTPYLSQLMELHPGADYWNWYGPTETNVCTAYRVPERPPPDAPTIPIGPAIDIVDAVVVDEEGSEVAPGDEGELLVAGPTVTPGYWGDPHKTAERLVHREGDGPFYRTGDIVIADGSSGFRFRGRRDHQVKSRGHRIELGEVEAALVRHRAVADAAVVATPDPLVTNLLTAFVVADGSVDPAGLLRHCRTALPAYMVPATIRELEALPRTSTGKVDRLSLAQRAQAAD